MAQRKLPGNMSRGAPLNFHLFRVALLSFTKEENFLVLILKFLNSCMPKIAGYMGFTMSDPISTLVYLWYCRLAKFRGLGVQGGAGHLIFVGTISDAKVFGLSYPACLYV